MERLKVPVNWAISAQPRLLWLAVNSDVRAMGSDLSRIFTEKPGRDGAFEMMMDLYRSMPRLCAPILSRLVDELLRSADALPLVIHCTAGKDRTGFVVAMILKLLGVSDADIAADYLQSNQLCDRPALNARVGALLRDITGTSPGVAALEAINSVHVDYLNAAFRQVCDDHGSFENYFVSQVGLDSAKTGAVRSLLLS